MNKVPVLFDVNGCSGKPSSGASEFPEMRDRLAFMDRFGIGRALVWNRESDQCNAGAANRALAARIRATPGAGDRLIPAFAVSGLMHYEAGGIDELAALMKRERARALRFVSVSGRLTLMQLEPVMRRIRRLHPFLVLRHDHASSPDILEFTKLFPDIPVILTEVMWGPCVPVFELMRRRRNILVDNSWLHSGGAIELVAEQFGADRLVFGMGPKCHNGAAIAALARAGITESERRLIACGNLERLTGLPRGAPVAAAIPKGNTLWPRFLEGKPLGVDAVDAHGHLGPSGGYVLKIHDERRQVAEALKVMDACGIRTMIYSGMQALSGDPVAGNDLLDAVLKPVASRFQGYLSFNPFYAADLLPRLDRYFAGPVYVGFKTLCDYWKIRIDDPRFAPMWAYANKHRLPVLNHTWDGGYDTPALLEKIAGRYPQAPLLIGHSGGGDPGRREAVALAKKHKNVYLEWCGSFCSSIPWEETLREVGADRVVYGTDAMVHDIHWELGRLLSLDVPDKVLIPILGGTMRKILARQR